MAAYYLANHEHIRAQAADYRDRNREAIQEQQRAAYAANPDGQREASSARYAGLTDTERVDRREKQNAARLRDPDRLDKRRQEQANVKREVIDGYGGRCACCGNDYLPHLTLDHVNGGGTAHRRVEGGRSLYRRLRRALREGLPLDPEFQVLCWNCNAAKHHLGACDCRRGVI